MILLCVHANTFYRKSAKLQPQNINHASHFVLLLLLLLLLVVVVVVVVVVVQ